MFWQLQWQKYPSRATVRQVNTDAESSRRLLRWTIALTVMCAACGSSSTAADTAAVTAAPTTAAAATTTAAAETTVVATTAVEAASTTTAVARPPLRGERYCEVLLLRPIDGKPSAEVYNTYPLNSCPDATWKAMDAAAIATENGVPLAVLNGPRYWLMDHIEKADGEAPAPVSFGGMEMVKRATVDLSSVGAGAPPYTGHHVNRKTVFGFDAGSTVFELHATDGHTYVMQSWSQQVDPALAEADLAGLGSRLQLPTGWTYGARTLTEPLEVVTTDTDAVVLQDDFQNSYSQETA